MFMKRGYLDQQRHTRDVVAQRKDPVRIQQEYNHGQDHVQDQGIGRFDFFQIKIKVLVGLISSLVFDW